MSSYPESIMEILGCSLEEAKSIEEIMRNTIFHSTLDWQTRAQFEQGARDAYEVARALGKIALVPPNQ
jgi:hypothetical protein